MDNREKKELSMDEMEQVSGGSDLRDYFTYLRGKYGTADKEYLKRRITPEEYAYWEYLSKLQESKRPEAVPCPAGYNPPV